MTCLVFPFYVKIQSSLCAVMLGALPIKVVFLFPMLYFFLQPKGGIAFSATCLLQFNIEVEQWRNVISDNVTDIPCINS